MRGPRRPRLHVVRCLMWPHYACRAHRGDCWRDGVRGSSWSVANASLRNRDARIPPIHTWWPDDIAIVISSSGISVLLRATPQGTPPASPSPTPPRCDLLPPAPSRAAAAKRLPLGSLLAGPYLAGALARAVYATAAAAPFLLEQIDALGAGVSTPVHALVGTAQREEPGERPACQCSNDTNGSRTLLRHCARPLADS